MNPIRYIVREASHQLHSAQPARSRRVQVGIHLVVVLEDQHLHSKHIRSRDFVSRHEVCVSSTALAELTEAQSMLPALGDWPSRASLPQHVPIWYSLASAYLSADDDDQAVAWLRRITESTTEHIYWPIPYVRSFYFPGKIHENRGEMDKAHASTTSASWTSGKTATSIVRGWKRLWPGFELTCSALLG